MLDEADSGVQDPELVVHLRDQIADLERQVEAAKATHVSEIGIISQMLSDAADENELCGAYDNTIAKINEHVTVKMLAREVEASIAVQGTVTFAFNRRMTVLVPMGSAADDPVNQDRVFNVIRSLGVRALTTSVVGDPTIEITEQVW